jgi:hypothetical protein
MRPQCIVFDLDDTLYLERNYVHSGFRALGEWAKTSLGVPDFADRASRLLAECGRKPEPGIVAHMVKPIPVPFVRDRAFAGRGSVPFKRG